MGYLDIQLEKVRGDIPELFRIGSTGLWSKFKTIPGERVGERGMRVPRLLSIGAQYGVYSSQGGNSIRGGVPTTEFMTTTFVERMIASELDRRDIEILKGADEVAKMNLFTRIMTAMPDEWGQAMEAELFSSGTITVVTGTAHALVGGKSQYTGDTITGVRFMRPGIIVTVFDTTGATFKGSSVVKSVDVINKTVLLSDAIAGAAGTDIIAYGVFAATPVGISGIPVWNDSAATGTLNGIDRAVQPEIRATRVNVAGAVDQQHELLLKHKMMARFGRQNMPMGQVAIIPLAVHATITLSMVSIQRSLIESSGAGTNVDRLPKLTSMEDFTWAGGQVHTVNEHQKSNRIDFVNPADYFWCELMPLEFFTDESGKKVHMIVGANGVPISRSWVSMTWSGQLMNPDPRKGGYLDGITIPADYQTF